MCAESEEEEERDPGGDPGVEERDRGGGSGEGTGLIWEKEGGG